jgi:hypothetical protein
MRDGVNMFGVSLDINFAREKHIPAGRIGIASMEQPGALCTL